MSGSMRVNPATLKGQQLSLHRIGADDYAVKVVNHAVGRIMAKPAPSGVVEWFWTFTGPCLPVDTQPSHGEAETLLKAKAAFRAKFDAWLRWAEKLGHPVVWAG